MRKNVLVFSLLVFCLMVVFTPVDLQIQAKVSTLWNPVLTTVMIFITNIVSTLPLFILSMTLWCYLVYKKRYRNALLAFCSIVGGIVFGTIFKHLIQRMRPEPNLVSASRYSFPSGHALISMIFFSLLIYFLKDDIKNKVLQNCFIVVNVVLIILIGFSRIYLNVHWFSDVIGGFALGLGWVTLLMLLEQKIKLKPKKK